VRSIKTRQVAENSVLFELNEELGINVLANEMSSTVMQKKERVIHVACSLHVVEQWILYPSTIGIILEVILPPIDAPLDVGVSPHLQERLSNGIL